ncbi:MAG: tetratricopeptide repeat-containing protein [Blastocatellia bacterium]
MSQHVFVAMPFGVKKDSAGKEIDFNRVYGEYIKPALEAAGFAVFRADEEIRAGSIHEDMFQELLLADLVIADLSIDNPNVWYELGVRHALRARGVVQIQGARDYLPFDVYGQRTLKYHLKDGAPDAEFLAADKEALADMARATVTSWQERKDSPVYHMLPNLTPPDWKTLRLGSVNEIWEAYEKWSAQIKTAQRSGGVGAILTLADEAPARALQVEAHRTAGKALTKLKHFAFALAQYDKALAINPRDFASGQQRPLLLGRLDRHAEARAALEELILARPDDAETRGLLGRLEKDEWVKAWDRKGNTPEQMRDDAAYETALLRKAIRAYEEGFRKDPRSYYVGINALTLRYLSAHLTSKARDARELQAMAGGVRWAIECELDLLADNPRDTYWALVTRGDLETLAGEPETVSEAYKEAIAVNGGDWFALDSSRQQLVMLQKLGFRPDNVTAGLRVFDREMGKLQAATEWAPQQVMLFSGHMIDAPDRPKQRFPADKEAIAAAEIAKELDEIGAGPEDMAICGAACGGDILFAEACLARGIRMELYIPFDIPTYLRESVNFAGDQWRERFYKVKDAPGVSLFIMPEKLGPIPARANPYERNNVWMMYSAQARGPEKVHFICLWNGQSGDGPGGTRHMYETVKASLGYAHWIDTTKLW